MCATKASRPPVTTRTALIEAGTQLILEKGYNNTGLEEILKEAKVHKGSFYHFFKNKEDFGLQVVAEYAAVRLGSLDEQLNNQELGPLARLRRYYELAGHRHQRLGYRKGCLFGNLGQEMADQSEVFRTRLEDVLSEYRAKIARCFREAQRVGDLRADLDVDRLAGFCLNSWEGALLRMKVAKSYEPLDDFLFVMFETVLKNPLAATNPP
jgi:TetR/AcrR family transcriptional repressor of nem operon